MIEIPSADDPSPQRVLVTSRSDVVTAVLAVIQRARRGVRCLHRDLAPFALAHSAVVDALHALLHSARAGRVRLLADDTHWLDTQAARLRLLQRQFSHAVELRRTSVDDPVGDDAVLLADDRHLFALGRPPQGPGEIWFNNEPRARALVAEFDRRWETATHNLPVDPLGL
jgi:hypothetical protein